MCTFLSTCSGSDNITAFFLLHLTATNHETAAGTRLLLNHSRDASAHPTRLSLPLNNTLPRLFLSATSYLFLLMAAKCVCCPNAEEPRAVPLSTANLATTLAPAEELWSSSRDRAVRLRMESSGPGSETPVTVHQMFLETVERYGDHPALVSKKDGQWETLTWRQYYEQCRAAAKSFLKVGGLF